MIDTSVLKEICFEAGKIILEIYNSDDFGVVKKDDDSPLTKADTAANDYIVTELNKHYPEVPILAEESITQSYSERKNWKNCFIVDPIDGTKEFIKKNGEFTVNIGYAENGVMIEGVIYAPVLDTYYYTENGHSFRQRDGQKKRLPCEPKNKIYTVVGSRSHLSERIQEYISELEKIHTEVKLLSVGSSLKFCMIAEGSADQYPRFNPTMEWDTAAAQAIVEQSGASVLDLKTKQPILYNRENLKNSCFIVERSNN
jgi:3'(2'), 5'-bisphosphate nucleotidase